MTILVLKKHIFHTASYFVPLLRVISLEFCNINWAQKTRIISSACSERSHIYIHYITH